MAGKRFWLRILITAIVFGITIAGSVFGQNSGSLEIWSFTEELYNIIKNHYIPTHSNVRVNFILYPNINSFSVKNGTHGTLEFNKIEYKYTVEREKKYHKIYFYNNSEVIRDYTGVWWEYESGSITGYADATDIVITFMLE